MAKPNIRIIEGRFYREIPKEQGLTCAEFASLINASDDTIRRWANAGRLATLANFDEIRIPFSELAANQEAAERFALSRRLEGREPNFEFRSSAGRNYP